MLPFEEEPSCCYLSPRVLSRSRYDAHWLRQASNVLNVHEALDTTARQQFPTIVSSSSRLQPTSRHFLPLSPGWDPGTSLGYRSFQRRHHRTRHAKLPVSQLPIHRFSQPHNRSFAPHGSRVYSTSLALLGFRPSKYYPETIESSHRTFMLLRRCLFHMASFPDLGDTPMSPSTADFPDSRTPKIRAPRSILR
jgi:hypothetical protein